MSGRVIILGSLNVDVVTRVERLPRAGETLLGEPEGRLAGGKGGNQAMAARRAGASVVMLGLVGYDGDGAAYLARLQDAGIEVPLPAAHDVPTGTAYITLDEAGENTIVVAPGANAALSDAGLDAVDLRAEDVLLASLEVPLQVVENAVRRAKDAGARAFINMAPYAALSPDVIAMADAVIVNESEMRLLAESGLMPTSLVVTFGSAGARWDGAEVTGIPLDSGQVVDTAGAGDAFCGALAAALVDGEDQESALAAANRAGAEAVQWSGAQPDAHL
ncbi:ribokinase [Demetria terragena]|uniref:ribokinase n=1 Tax=Demetria terragena TaxID=63959 RepID=UPI00037F682C|nr:ribokinase [Demetria terragena]